MELVGVGFGKHANRGNIPCMKGPGSQNDGFSVTHQHLLKESGYCNFVAISTARFGVNTFLVPYFVPVKKLGNLLWRKLLCTQMFLGHSALCNQQYPQKEFEAFRWNGCFEALADIFESMIRSLVTTFPFFVISVLCCFSQEELWIKKSNFTATFRVCLVAGKWDLKTVARNKTMLQAAYQKRLDLAVLAKTFTGKLKKPGKTV